MKPITISAYRAMRDESADYLCDGIGDEKEIYAASEAAGENGVLCFRPGTYYIQGTLWSACSQLWLVSLDVKFEPQPSVKGVKDD